MRSTFPGKAVLALALSFLALGAAAALQSESPSTVAKRVRQQEKIRSFSDEIAKDRKLIEKLRNPTRPAGTRNETELADLDRSIASLEAGIERAYREYRVLGGSLGLQDLLRPGAELPTASEKLVLDDDSIQRRGEQARMLTTYGFSKKQRELAEDQLYQRLVMSLPPDVDTRTSCATRDQADARLSALARSYAQSRQPDEQGTCEIGVLIGTDGVIDRSELVRSTGSSSLDRACLTAAASGRKLDISAPERPYFGRFAIRFASQED